MSYSNKAAAVTPPVADVNLWISASAITHKAILLPTKSGILTLQADGADFYVALSTSASAEVDPADVTTESGSAFTAGTAPKGCIKIADGNEVDWDLSLVQDERALYLIVEASAAGGYLRIWRSSGPVKVS